MIDWEYIKKLISLCAIIVGATLLIEHLMTWGGFDWGDWLGHEFYGLILIIIGFIVGLRIK